MTAVLAIAADYAAAQVAAGRQRQFRLVDSLIAMAIVGAISFASAGLVCRWGARRCWSVAVAGAVALAINCVVAGFLTLVFLVMFSMPPH